MDLLTTFRQTAPLSIRAIIAGLMIGGAAGLLFLIATAEVAIALLAGGAVGLLIAIVGYIHTSRIEKEK